MLGITSSSASVEEVVESGLLERLDEELLERYPGEPVNGIVPDEFRASGGYFVIARHGEEIVGCGAFRPFGAETVEIKRMYISKQYRGHGIARVILEQLEAEARERGFTRGILETGIRMPEAIALYGSRGYYEIERYEPYVESERSVCFAKTLE